MASNVLSLAESPLAAGPCGSGICCLLRRCLCRSCRITGCCRSCLPSRWSWLKYTPGAKMQSACHSWGLRFFVSEGNSFLSIKLLQLSGNASAASSLDNPALTAAWPGFSGAQLGSDTPTAMRGKGWMGWIGCTLGFECAVFNCNCWQQLQLINLLWSAEHCGADLKNLHSKRPKFGN